MHEVTPLLDLAQTGNGMGKLVELYHDDILPYCSLSLVEFYEFVKRLPYKEDPPNRELVSRPRLSLGYESISCDCDDKCVIVGSYMYIKRIPFRFVAVQIADDETVSDFHHVFPEIKILEEWITYDATYEWMKLGTKKNEKKRKVLYSHEPSDIFCQCQALNFAY